MYPCGATFFHSKVSPAAAMFASQFVFIFVYVNVYEYEYGYEQVHGRAVFYMVGSLASRGPGLRYAGMT